MTTSEVMLDFKRSDRIGLDESILCQGKTPDHLTDILAKARDEGARFLLTRLAPDQLAALSPADRAQLDYDPVSRTAFFGAPRAVTGPARIAVVAAGTSDAPVFREVQRTLTWNGAAWDAYLDVGVAGLWRLMSRVDQIREHDIAIAVAGMDAALPTVLGGLFGGVVIACPTSTGYGVSEGGRAALHAILSSCSPGVVTLNIDNGYGAACAALRVLNTLARARGP